MKKVAIKIKNFFEDYVLHFLFLCLNKIASVVKAIAKVILDLISKVLDWLERYIFRNIERFARRSKIHGHGMIVGILQTVIIICNATKGENKFS